MPREFSSWHPLALERGYTSEREMLEDMYERSRLSIREMEGVLDRPYTTIKFRLEMHGINLRRRGGSNHRKED